MSAREKQNGRGDEFIFPKLSPSITWLQFRKVLLTLCIHSADSRDNAVRKGGGQNGQKKTL